MNEWKSEVDVAMAVMCVCACVCVCVCVCVCFCGIIRFMRELLKYGGMETHIRESWIPYLNHHVFV